MMASVYENRYEVLPLATDRFGRMLPSMMLRLSQQISGEHCTILGVDQPYLDEKGLFWAIIRSDLQISRIPAAGEMLKLRTWPMPTTRTAYPRAVIAYDEAGEEVFRVSSLWILMDRESRAMVLPGKSGVEVNGIEAEQIALPRSLSPITPNATEDRSVRFLDLDKNQHMNNARYLDWVYDALPDDFHEDHRLRRAALCYLNEARFGHDLTLGWAFADENSLQMDISRQNLGRIFSAKLDFDIVVP